jgi:hypothetical protein
MRIVTHLWNDAVWSKVIATIILSAGAIVWAFAGRSLRKWRRGNVSIKVIDTVVFDPDPKKTLVFPLKCYVEMRNESPVSIEVSLSDFEKQSVELKRFVTGVLQVNFNSAWYPSPDGVDRIAVLPRQMFRAWVGIDESKFTAEQVRRLKWQIGEAKFIC